MVDYSSLDRSSVLQHVFYPRRDVTPSPENALDLPIRVKEYFDAPDRLIHKG